MLKYLHEKRTEEAITYAMVLAAENGHLNVVKYLYENRTGKCNRIGF